MDLLKQLPHSDALWPLIIIATSLLGSWHCVGMCGPLACSPALHGKSKYYHLGRMLSYVSLGILSGAFGELLLNSNDQWLRVAAASLMGFLLMTLGFSYFFDIKLPNPSWWKFFLPALRKVQGQAFLIGLLSALLPCGWLYSFVLIAATTKSALTGALVMFLFWLGTVPALSFLSAGMANLIVGQKLTHRRLVGLIFIGAGFYSLFTHFYLQK